MEHLGIASFDSTLQKPNKKATNFGIQISNFSFMFLLLVLDIFHIIKSVVITEHGCCYFYKLTYFIFRLNSGMDSTSLCISTWLEKTFFVVLYSVRRKNIVQCTIERIILWIWFSWLMISTKALRFVGLYALCCIFAFGYKWNVYFGFLKVEWSTGVQWLRQDN